MSEQKMVNAKELYLALDAAEEKAYEKRLKTRGSYEEGYCDGLDAAMRILEKQAGQRLDK